MLIATDPPGPDGPYLTPIGAIDDATGTVPWAVFREQEDAADYLEVLHMVVQTKGIPLALYVDRHCIFERNRCEPLTLEEELAGGRLPTQVGRVVGELGIAHIAARSPQAKGRGERLWGTCRDRLMSMLRLAGAQVLAEADAVLGDWLPQFNARFAVPPAQPGSAYRPVPEGCRPEQVFCFKYLRSVAVDNIVRLGAQRLQCLPSPDRLSYARTRVEVHERLDAASPCTTTDSVWRRSPRRLRRRCCVPIPERGPRPSWHRSPHPHRGPRRHRGATRRSDQRCSPHRRRPTIPGAAHCSRRG